MTAAHVAEIERLNRLYSALSHVNQAIVRTRTRGELFRKVCDALVERGGFRMAWIGWHDPASQRLVPVAHAGDEGGYLQSVEVYADDRTKGRGPSGHAFRDDRPYVCNDTLNDPVTVPWRTELEHHGFRASAVFPIRADGAVGGTLAVYADRPGIFRDKELALLTEAASDISFALDNFSREDARERSEEIVKRFAAIVESTDDAIVSKTLDGVITSWNPAAERLFGYGAAEIIGRSIGVIIPEDRADEEPFILGRVRRGERITQFETIRLRKDGTLLPVSITVSPIWGPDDVSKRSVKIIGVSKIVRDITERKDAEALAEREQLRASPGRGTAPARGRRRCGAPHAASVQPVMASLEPPGARDRTRRAGASRLGSGLRRKQRSRCFNPIAAQKARPTRGRDRNGQGLRIPVSRAEANVMLDRRSLNRAADCGRLQREQSVVAETLILMRRRSEPPANETTSSQLPPPTSRVLLLDATTSETWSLSRSTALRRFQSLPTRVRSSFFPSIRV